MTRNTPIYKISTWQGNKTNNPHSLIDYISTPNHIGSFCFILISWGCITSPTFSLFFLQWINFMGPSQKTVETIETPQNTRSYGKMESFPLRPTYIGEKGSTLGKTYGIQVRCCWEHLWGTHWEPYVNPLGTWREHVGNNGRMKKISTWKIWFQPTGRISHF